MMDRSGMGGQRRTRNTRKQTQTGRDGKFTSWSSGLDMVSCRITTLCHNPEDLDLNLHRRENSNVARKM
jgi:hypothetical protein